jgi:hypothetical protein
VALDQNQTHPSSAIENELPAYRAISPHAVLSLIFGLLAILTFANWAFLAFAAAGIGLGLLAERKIRRDPEIWTGRGMAQAGMALGLVFGLSAVTTTLVQDFLRSQAASRFVKQYASVLKSGSVEDALFYTIPPQGRENRKPAELYKELKSHADPRGLETQYATIEKIKRRLDAAPGEEVHFDKLEAHGLDGLTLYATALLELHGPGSKEFPEKEQHAMLLLKGMNTGKKTEWWIEDAKFPYEPASSVHQQKPVDDGHGHNH